MAGVTRYEDLRCHQLAVQLRREILRLTRREAVRRDYKYLHQIRDAARSAPRNIAEGYSRFNPAEILQFLGYAKASVDETHNHLIDGRDSGYFSANETQQLLDLIGRITRALLRWMAYLDSPAARDFYARHKARVRGGEHWNRPPGNGRRKKESQETPKNPGT